MPNSTCPNGQVCLWYLRNIDPAVSKLYPYWDNSERLWLRPRREGCVPFGHTPPKFPP
jgi:hypothetical protein